MQSEGQAIRDFEDQVRMGNNPIADHPEDYSLFLVAEMYDNDGSVEPLPTPKCLRNAHEVQIDNGEN